MKRWMGMTLIVSGTLLLVLVAGGCGESAQSLEDTQWILTQYVAADGSLSPALELPEVTATFAGGAVQGSGGCNTYNGSYEIDGSDLTISPLASTMMACEQPVLDQETAFFAGMAATATYSFDDGALVLSDEAAETLLVFEQFAD